MAARGLLVISLVIGVIVVVDVTAQHYYPPWQQYYPLRRWSFYDEQVHGRPPRVRVGQGHFRLLPVGAELMCDFPRHLRLVSNVVWERADLGDRNSLNMIYRAFGVPHEFSVHTRPHGSTLHLFNASPVDRGLYRCIVTAIDTASPMHPQLTAFQDIEFFPMV